MRAVRYDGSDVFLDRAAGAREPGPGEAIVAPMLVGVDEADLAVVRGSTGFKGIIGHQFVGRVVGVGPGVDGSLVGSRVVADPAVPDPQSDAARAGLGEHDAARRVLGLRGLDGCMADRFVIPANALCPVPESVDDHHAVLAVPLARTLHAARLLRIERKTYVTVVGEDLPALLMAQVLSPLNTSVRLLSPSAAHLSFAERWGVRHRESDAAGSRSDQDVVIVSGSSEDALGRAFDRAFGLVRPRGTLLVLSGAPGNATMPVAPMLEHELTMIGARGGRVRHAIEVMHAGTIDLDGLISARFTLDDAVGALRAAADPEMTRCVIAA